MDWKTFFKPTKGKIITSLLLTAVYVANLWARFSAMMCKPCAFITNESWPEIFSTCDCQIGNTFFGFIKEIFTVIILPFAIIYLMYSAISYLWMRNKN